ncbi:MAG TPA: efflux RND transporter permease subunit [Candidatus Acidoferrales bacterium]|nr:efflux RND transporter permease subunit [Candidatus Acidoferrum sp.]HUJ83650.1 efflux RND transporter permease subunit [Candidatus Acidoferrales bacterium]
MIHRIVQFALRQRFLVLMMAVLIIMAGTISFQRMPVDAYPDLSPPLAACLGLLPTAVSTGIGSDTQKPFAIVIVAGLISRLFLGFFVNPVLYKMVAHDGDVLQV